MAKQKERLDVLLVNQGYFDSRARAQGAIMAGQVHVDGQMVDKPGQRISPDATIEVQGKKFPFVSRGGLKLQRAVEHFQLDLQDKVVLDIGASTGGFTDCALRHGAKRVYAVDVGYGQLAWELRQDERVVVLERTNARYLTAEHVPEPVDITTIDVSFISLGLILPAVVALLMPAADVIALIKPQFEAGRQQVGKKGVVRDPAVHAQVIKKVWDEASQLGLSLSGLTYSPITGPEGNIEFLAWFRHGGQQTGSEDVVQQVVQEAHDVLGKR